MHELDEKYMKEMDPASKSGETTLESPRVNSPLLTLHRKIRTLLHAGVDRNDIQVVATEGNNIEETYENKKNFSALYDELAKETGEALIRDAQKVAPFIPRIDAQFFKVGVKAQHSLVLV